MDATSRAFGCTGPPSARRPLNTSATTFAGGRSDAVQGVGEGVP